MRIFAHGMPCDGCGEVLTNWDYRYRGKHYCRSCYQRYFSLRKCEGCGKNKMILKTLSTPLCKICQVKDEPCLRCGRTITSVGKILEHGPVCAACSRYFRTPKRCTICKKEKLGVFRYTIDNKKVLACTNCYSKTLPICHLCRRHKKTYTLTAEGKSICKACSGKPRVCRQCGNSFPAGRGRICHACSHKNGLSKKVDFGKQALSPYYAEIFEDFAAWLLKKRGVEFASHRLLYFFPFFKDLDMYAEQLHRRPDYREMLSHFTVARCKSNYTVMNYLNHAKYIHIDPVVKEEYANFDMIDRYLKTFQEGTLYGKLVDSYYQYMEEKHLRGKVKIRSVRLALATAVLFLRYCQHCKAKKPSKKMLHDYLWCFWGQKASLTGFITYLNKEHGYALDIHHISKPILRRPSGSREMLKQQFIQLLHDQKNGVEIDRDRLIRTAIEYLHWVHVPRTVNIGFSRMKKEDDGYMLPLAGHLFYLPKLQGI